MGASDTLTDESSRTSRETFLEYQRSAYEVLSNRYILILLTIVPAALLFSFVNVAPIVWAIVGSFYEIPAYSPEWTWVGISSYVSILQDPGFWASVKRAILFAGGSVAFQLVVGIGVALLVNRSFRGQTLVRTIVLMPYLVPTAVIGFIALWMGNSQFGIINQILVQLGFISHRFPWFGNTDTAMIAAILTSSWKFAMFVTIMVLARLQSIPEGLYEAAEIMGATTYERFRDVTLPNIKGVIFIVVLLRGVWMFNKFDIIYVLTGGGPRQVTTTTPIYAYKIAFNQLSLGRAATISTLLFIMLLGAAFIYFSVLEPEQEVRVE